MNSTNQNRLDPFNITKPMNQNGIDPLVIQTQMKQISRMFNAQPQKLKKQFIDKRLAEPKSGFLNKSQEPVKKMNIKEPVKTIDIKEPEKTIDIKEPEDIIDIEETVKVEQGGYYHKYNFLKYRIAFALYLLNRSLDTKEIGHILNESRDKISQALSHYKSTGCPYFKRVPKFKGASNHDMRWLLTKSGINFLANCIVNIHSGKDLNFKRNRPQLKIKDRKVLEHNMKNFKFDKDVYIKFFGINNRGMEKGLSLDEITKDIKKYNNDGFEMLI
jgi:hypothetical protein